VFKLSLSLSLSLQTFVGSLEQKSAGTSNVAGKTFWIAESVEAYWTLRQVSQEETDAVHCTPIRCLSGNSTI